MVSEAGALMPDWISHEPALWAAIVTAGLDLVIAFGVPITPEQKTAILGVSAAVLAVLGGVVVRANVTPQAKIDQVPIAKAALLEAEAKH